MDVMVEEKCRTVPVVPLFAVLYQLCHFSSTRLEVKWHNWYSTALFLHKTATIWGSTPGRPQVVEKWHNWYSTAPFLYSYIRATDVLLLLYLYKILFYVEAYVHESMIFFANTTFVWAPHSPSSSHT